jgi:hypothetical protein
MILGRTPVYVLLVWTVCSCGARLGCKKSSLSLILSWGTALQLTEELLVW